MPEPTIALSVHRAPGAVRLEWSGGRAPFTLERARDPQFTDGLTTLVDEQAVTTFDDPVLEDGVTWFYRVR